MREKRILDILGSGEHLVCFVRKQFYSNKAEYEQVVQLLMGYMGKTEMSEAQMRRCAEDILIGRATLTGSVKAGACHFEAHEPGEEEQLPAYMNIWKEPKRRKMQRTSWRT